MIGVDAESFLVIVSAAAVAAIISALVAPRLVLPVVVVELLLGILIGPQVADLAQVDAATTFFSSLGLGMLFFFAGYEIDFERIKGRPLALGAGGWLRVARARVRPRRHPLRGKRRRLGPLHGLGRSRRRRSGR